MFNVQKNYRIKKIIISFKIQFSNKNKKSGYVDVALLYSRLQVGHCKMDCIKFEFNDIISFYTKNYSEWRRFISLDILYCYYLLQPVN